MLVARLVDLWASFTDTQVNSCLKLAQLETDNRDTDKLQKILHSLVKLVKTAADLVREAVEGLLHEFAFVCIVPTAILKSKLPGSSDLALQDVAKLGPLLCIFYEVMDHLTVLPFRAQLFETL